MMVQEGASPVQQLFSGAAPDKSFANGFILRVRQSESVQEGGRIIGWGSRRASPFWFFFGFLPIIRPSRRVFRSRPGWGNDRFRVSQPFSSPLQPCPRGVPQGTDPGQFPRFPCLKSFQSQSPGHVLPVTSRRDGVPLGHLMQRAVFAMFADQFDEGQSSVAHKVLQHTPGGKPISGLPVPPGGRRHSKSLRRCGYFQPPAVPPALQCLRNIGKGGIRPTLFDGDRGILRIDDTQLTKLLAMCAGRIRKGDYLSACSRFIN